MTRATGARAACAFHPCPRRENATKGQVPARSRWTRPWPWSRPRRTRMWPRARPLRTRQLWTRDDIHAVTCDASSRAIKTIPHFVPMRVSAGLGGARRPAAVAPDVVRAASASCQDAAASVSTGGLLRLDLGPGLFLMSNAVVMGRSDFHEGCLGDCCRASFQCGRCCAF